MMDCHDNRDPDDVRAQFGAMVLLLALPVGLVALVGWLVWVVTR